MGTVFDKKLGESYDAWYQSAHGRTLDLSVTRLIKTLIRPLYGERILDVGCGSGNHLLTFSRLGLDGSGIDPSATMLSQARERLGEGCCLRRAEAEDLPFEDNEFDLVSMINTLEFVENPAEALREAGRVASRRVFIVTINSFSCLGASSKIKGMLGEPLFGSAHTFSILELKELVARAYGSVPITWRSVSRPPQLLRPFSKTDEGSFTITKLPFGHIIGLAATMKYVLRTDNITVKAKVKEPRLRLVRPTTAEPVKQNCRRSENERSLSL
jgi:ubiquinone/menaquinone biosynthesis C-methylase UbiE